jgi:hypothetical protein
MGMIVCGIDPDTSGAIAFIDADSGALVAVEDVPVDTVQKGKHSRSRVNLNRLKDILFRARGAAAFVERPDYRPMRGTNKQTGKTEMRQIGALGAGTMGESFMASAMCCVCADMALTEMSPGEWKKSIGAPGNKDDARRRAAELFPAWAHMLKVKDDHGRADAILLAYFGMLKLRGGIRG